MAQSVILDLLPDMLTVMQAAEVLRIHPMTAYKLARHGTLPYVRLGRSIRVPKAALLQMMQPVGA